MPGNDLTIRRFTPPAQKIFNLLPTDVGRPFGNINPRINGADLQAIIAGVLENLFATEKEVTDQEGNSYLLQVLPTAPPKIGSMAWSSLFSTAASAPPALSAKTLRVPTLSPNLGLSAKPIAQAWHLGLSLSSLLLTKWSCTTIVIWMFQAVPVRRPFPWLQHIARLRSCSHAKRAPQGAATPLFSGGCSLFVVSRPLQSFKINNLQSLFAKQPVVWG